MSEYGDGAFMISPELLVQVLMQSRRIGEGDGKEKCSNDSQRAEATRFRVLAPKEIPAHDSELARKCTLRKPDFKARRRTRLRRFLFRAVTGITHDATGAQFSNCSCEQSNPRDP